MATLYVVGTPIGNLSDASSRMVETLRAVSLIAAEDTRVTAKLLNHFDIHTPLTSCHQHNERDKARRIVERMVLEDIDVALVTDAGMPGVSDPGSILVAEAVAAGLELCSVPGPSAALAALSISGMDCTSFAFYGFLPRQKSELRARLLEIARATPVFILYESPHRILSLMGAVAEILPGCRACVCSDLTKRFEAAYRGEAREVLEALQANPNVEKGEYCVVLDASDVALPAQAQPAESPEAALLHAMLDGADLRQALEQATQNGISRNEAYRASLRLKEFLQAWGREGG